MNERKPPEMAENSGKPARGLEAPSGFEPLNKGFAGLYSDHIPGPQLSENATPADRANPLRPHSGPVTSRFITPDWRKELPAAAAERYEPMDEFAPVEPMPDGAEYWENSRYNVTVRKHDSDPVFGGRHGMIQLGISAADGTARHDWRDFQAIKNRFAGPEAEAFELYPAESRLIDPSNYYILWCFPRTQIRVGHNFRRVIDAAAKHEAPQRAFANEAKL